jgi:Flp pilus assembly protein TadG
MKEAQVPKRRNQKGAAAVELAILLIPLLLIAAGVTELGRAFFQYNALVKGTRDGVRFLTLKGPLDPADPATAQNTAEARCLVVYGNRTCTGTARVPELSPGMITICDSATCPATHSAQPTGTGVINLVTVTISGYTFMPIVSFLVPSPLTFNDISATMRQVL